MATSERYFPPFRLDLADQRLWRGEQPIDVRPKTFAVLTCLTASPGRLLTKAALFDAVWPETAVSDTVLKVCIRELRQVLEDDYAAPRFIETIRGRGYRFIAAVSAPEEPDGAPEGWPADRLRGSYRIWQEPMPRPLVGRAPDIRSLQHHLAQALNGRRQMVFVSGEAGLGKTALVNAFVNDLCDPQRLLVGRGQCIEHYGSGEAYMPVLEALDQCCQAPGGERLVALLARQAPTWLRQLPWLVGDDELERLHRATFGATSERMLREMARALEMLTVETPLIVVLEDLHWVDYSTLDLLAVLARRRQPARLLVLGTYRPEEVMGGAHPLHTVVQELRLHGQCRELSLTPLPTTAVEDYLKQRLATEGSLYKLAAFIRRRTDGNALFMVNMVDDMLTRNLLDDLDAHGALSQRLQDAELGVPEDLQQMFAQQFERLQPDEQRLLEVASIAGVEFDAALLAPPVDTGIEQVEACCEGLARRGQWLQPCGRSVWPNGTVSGRYCFVHALNQEAVYSRVTAARRVRLHRQIGEQLEAGYGVRAQALAAELTLHFELGGEPWRAVHYREQAGQNAIRRSAYQEAMAHLSRGLELLKDLPHRPESALLALRLYIGLGVSLVATKGFAAREVEQLYREALHLCRHVEDASRLFVIRRGLYICYLVRGEHHQALDFAQQLLQLATRLADSTFRLLAHYGLGQTLFFLADLAGARKYLAQGIALSNRAQHHTLPLRHVSPGVTCRSYSAWTLWLLGYGDRARQLNHEALTLAREIAQPFILAFALTYAAAFHQRRGEVQRTRERAESAIALASEHGFAHWLAHARILHGWALTAQGRHAEGIDEMCQGLRAYRATGAQVQVPYYFGMLAAAYGDTGRSSDGLAVLAEALSQVKRSGECWYEAELYRLKGELTLMQYDDHSAEAESCFRQALDIARRQQAKSWELRAAVSLARLWQSQDKRQAAYDLLAPVHGWFTEGLDTADLKDARVLLQGLSRTLDAG